MNKISKFFLFLTLVLFALCPCESSLASVEKVQYTDKLIIEYKSGNNEAVSTFSNNSNLGVLPFEKILSNVIGKLQATGKLQTRPIIGLPTGLLFRTSEESTLTTNIAYIENTLSNLDSYVVKVNDISNIELIKKELEKEAGVSKITQDFLADLPPIDILVNKEPNLNITQSCTVTPGCETGRPVCLSGTLTCPLGKRPVCVFLSSKPPFSACLGNGRITPGEAYCDLGLQALPEDPYNLENWHYEKTGLSKTWNQTCKCPQEIELSKCNISEHPEFCRIGDLNTVIAVLDNGFSVGSQVGTIGHPDLAGMVDSIISQNVIFNDNPFDYDSSDEPSSKVVYDHGTASVLSSSASGNNTKSHAGVNFNSKIWAVRIGRGASASFSNILAGFNYVIGKVQESNIKRFFINLSYGSGDCNKSLAKAVNDFAGLEVKNRGGLITLASGNEACAQDFEDIAPHVIVVGATSSSSPCINPVVASYSNYGTLTDIFSPSGFIVDNRNSGIENYELSKQVIHGTSFSAPSLAGYGSLLWASNQNLSPDDVEKILKVSSFNSRFLFDGDQSSKDKIKLSQASQVSIYDAITLQEQILNLMISTDPQSDKQDLFVNVNNVVNVTVILPASNESLGIEALDLPAGAMFEPASGTSSVSQLFFWNPDLSQLDKKFPVTFLVKNSQSKVIGYKKILFTVKEKQENHPPIINAGSTKIVRPKQLVRFDDATALDEDNDNLTYEWTLPEVPLVPLLRINPTQLNKAGFYVHPMDKGLVDLKFRLTVSDGVHTVSSDVVYGVKNFPPQINAGPDRYVRKDTLVLIGSSQNLDPDGDVLKFSWAQVGGPPVTILTSNTQYLVFKTPPVLAVPGNEIVFRLKVEDGFGGISFDDVSVFVVR